MIYPLTHRKREDDGRVLLSRDGVEGLEVSQLQGPGAARDHLAGGPQGGARLLFSLRRDDLRDAVKAEKINGNFHSRVVGGQD